jgi:hypothetical protein
MRQAAQATALEMLLQCNVTGARQVSRLRSMTRNERQIRQPDDGCFAGPWLRFKLS